MSRLENTRRNILTGYMSQLLRMLLGVVSRAIFVRVLSADYLGIEGLFGNILQILSFSELGIGAAITFALYKPLAEGDTGKIKAYAALLRKTYRIVMLVTAVAGLLCLPLIPFIVSGGGVPNLQLYYLLYLTNTVFSYVAAYKRTVLSAAQKQYINNKIDALAGVLVTAGQIAVLLLWRNFLLYLLLGVLGQLALRALYARAANRAMPMLAEPDAPVLDPAEKTALRANVKGLVVQRAADMAIHQTDNIIIARVLGLASVGLAYNYIALRDYGLLLIGIVVNSAVAGLGNLVASEGKVAQLTAYRCYKLVSYWLYGWFAVGLLCLGGPIVRLWLGEDWVLGPAVVLLLALRVAVDGENGALFAIKAAAGVFHQDKYVAVTEACINLLVSVIFALHWGLAGIYFGTVVSAMFGVAVRGRVVYGVLFAKQGRLLAGDALRYITWVLCAGAGCYGLVAWMQNQLGGWALLLTGLAVCVLLPNGLFVLLFGRRSEFKELWRLGKEQLKRLFGHKQY